MFIKKSLFFKQLSKRFLYLWYLIHTYLTRVCMKNWLKEEKRKLAYEQRDFIYTSRIIRQKQSDIINSNMENVQETWLQKVRCCKINNHQYIKKKNVLLKLFKANVSRDRETLILKTLILKLNTSFIQLECLFICVYLLVKICRNKWYQFYFTVHLPDNKSMWKFSYPNTFASHLLCQFI